MIGPNRTRRRPRPRQPSVPKRSCVFGSDQGRLESWACTSKTFEDEDDDEGRGREPSRLTSHLSLLT
jgi:hypothetical protein